MAGNLNSDGVIWVVGEATGQNNEGEYGQAIPADSVDTGTDTLRDELVASGILPA